MKVGAALDCGSRSVGPPVHISMDRKAEIEQEVGLAYKPHTLLERSEKCITGWRSGIQKISLWGTSYMQTAVLSMPASHILL